MVAGFNRYCQTWHADTFTKDGQDFVHRIEGKKVVLIDGEQLADLMTEHNLEVTATKPYETLT